MANLGYVALGFSDIKSQNHLNCDARKIFYTAVEVPVSGPPKGSCPATNDK